MTENLALLADGNSSAARRARVKLQPRDKKGRWVPTGAALLAAIRGLDGVAKKYKLKAIGGTATSKGEENRIRALLTEDAPELGLKKNTVLEIDPKNGELDTGVKLSKDFLRRKGIDPDLQHTLPKSIAEQPQSVADLNPQPADDLDIELANGELTDEEDKDFRAERDQEPLAKLPPALADDVAEGQEVRDIIDKAAAKPTKPYKVSFTDNGYAATNDHGKVFAWGTYGDGMDDAERARVLKELEDYELPTKEDIEGFDFPEGYVGKDRGRFGGFEAYQLDENGKAIPGTLVEVSNDTDFDWDDQDMWSVGDPMGNAVYLDPDLYSFRTSDKDEAIARAAELARKLTGTSSKNDGENQNGLSDELLEKAASLEEKFDLVDKAKGPNSKGMRAAPDLKPGDVIVDPNGNNWTVTDKPKVSALDNAKVDIKLKNDQGQTLTTTAAMTRTFPLATPAPAAKTPAAKVPNTTAPNAAPSAPKKKTVAPPPPKPTAKPKASTPKKPPVIPANRKDNGQDIAPNTRPLGDMQAVQIANQIDPTTGKVLKINRKNVEDPNAIYDALLEMNPQAKIDPSGHIILERQDFTDRDGKVYKYEVAVAKTHGNKFIERYSFTDESGNTQTFYHYDYKDSFASIYGDKNGVYAFRDHILGKTSPEAPKRKNGEENRVYKAFWAEDKTLEDRIRYFRGAHSKGWEPTDEDLTKTQASAVKMLTPEELVRKYLQGYAEKYNLSGQARGTLLQSFVGSVWEAIEADDMTTFEARIQQLLGRLPDDESSRNLLMTTLRDGIKKKFNGTSLGRKVSPLANNIEKKILTEGMDIRDLNRRPFSSKDGKTIVETGNKVRYWNNVGEWSIGQVVAQLPPRTSSGGKNTYDDVVAVKFGDGSIHLLRSNRMDVLGDELDTDLNLHDKDSDATTFKPNLKGQELRDERGFGYSFGDEENQQSENAGLQPDEVGSTADQDAAAPYLGEQGVEADAPQAEETEAETAAEGNIGDFEAGDVWPDENGDPLGTFVEAQKVSDPDTGLEAWAVYWMDDNGDEQIEVIELDSSRVPK